MAFWRFKCYLDANGVDVIDEWYQSVSDAVQAKFDTRLRFLQRQPPSGWRRPEFDKLSGECAGLSEIRFLCEKVQYRLIGFFSGEMEYTLLFVAVEKGDKFKPKSTCKIAKRRMKEVQEDERRTHDHEVD